MSSLDSLKIREILAEGTVIQAGTDVPVAIRIRKLGSESATSVTVTTGTNIVLVGSTTTDTVTFATYTTYGAVVDQINTTGRWEAKILDALRSTASVSTLVTGTITAGTDANGVVVWDALQDTSASLQIAVCLSSKRNFDSVNGHRVNLQQVVYAVNMGSAAADSFQVWIRNSKGTETKVFGDLSVDTTATTYSFALGFGKITSKNDGEIIVLVKDAATLADATSNYVRAVGTIE